MTASRRFTVRWWPVALAWALWVVAMAGLAVSVAVDQTLRRAGWPELVVLTRDAVPPLLGAAIVVTVGAVLASRRPRHPVSWLLLAFGLALSAAGVTVVLANLGVANGGMPAAGLARYVPTTIVVAMVCNAFVLALTPTGALPSRRWRWWAAVTAGTPVALLLVVTFAPWPTTRLTQPLDSPLDLRPLDGVVMGAYRAAFAVGIAAVVVAGASLVVRFRRARGVERQQLRWVAFATVVVALLGVVNVVAL
ncbi:MAG TPA: hypothetical protein VK891_17265, partial [Euzebyales bacterium]|nr:hypothetical protein [Euzebyales bacterium]